jgi:hypothetical protein
VQIINYKRGISVLNKIGSHIGPHFGFWRSMQAKLLKNYFFEKERLYTCFGVRCRSVQKKLEWMSYYIHQICMAAILKMAAILNKQRYFGPTSLLKSTWSEDDFLKVSCLYHNLHYFDSRDVISRPTFRCDDNCIFDIISLTSSHRPK